MRILLELFVEIVNRIPFHRRIAVCAITVAVILLLKEPSNREFLGAMLMIGGEIVAALEASASSLAPIGLLWCGVFLWRSP